MKSALVLALALVASSAFAAEVTGRSSLTIYTDGSFGQRPEVIRVELVQTDDGAIRSMGGDALINLVREGGTLSGYAYDGFVRFSCEEGRCSGSTASASSSFSVARLHGQTRLEGSLGFRRFTAMSSPERIAISADGSLVLERDRSGVYHGRGTLVGREFGSFETFSATLDGEGTLAEITDPALLTVYLVAPLVR